MLYPQSAGNKVKAKFDSRSAVVGAFVYIFIREIEICVRENARECFAFLNAEENKKSIIVFFPRDGDSRFCCHAKNMLSRCLRGKLNIAACNV